MSRAPVLEQNHHLTVPENVLIIFGIGNCTIQAPATISNDDNHRTNHH
jgi:hypothetical protein